jgi:uncharacterized protein with HEPN domain
VATAAADAASGHARTGVGDRAVRRDRDRLLDILEATTKIRARVAHGHDRFDTDEDLQIVLTHLIQIIGEAASRLSPELTNGHPEVPWRQIIGMRHRVVHDYFAIDPDILWTAATRDIPPLAAQIHTILDELPPEQH